MLGDKECIPGSDFDSPNVLGDKECFPGPDFNEIISLGVKMSLELLQFYRELQVYAILSEPELS